MTKCTNCGKRNPDGPTFHAKYNACNKYESHRKPTHWCTACWEAHQIDCEAGYQRHLDEIEALRVRFNLPKDASDVAKEDSMRRISDHEAADMRKTPLGHIPGCGEVAVMIASGRSRCRQCGEKIAKGTEALATVYDFKGGGLAGDPWTGTEIQIHRSPCGEPSDI